MYTEPLKIQLQKYDEGGITEPGVEQLYSELEEWAAENPDGGIEQDFSLQVLGVTANSSMLFVAINRLGIPVKNVSFVYSLGLKSGEWIWNRVRLHLSEDQMGVIMPDCAIPLLVDLSPEQETLFGRMTESNQVGEIEYFTYDRAE
ncbi:hypothetical protein AV656_06450 [Bhargavaea cecembensis]|uniref:Uncharacterized protein n=1 Tax=Bhargavaea cecembensis TaxID=394098 RepID=A0A161SLJ3_9BACL|nr:hypothetical protein [Bhargavaea cecembensis]KZE38543.1 hypothetical protein AV656_06450 [Bhargavaea cecembensis]